MGVKVSRVLRDAGVKVLAHVCDGGGAFIRSFAEAQQLNPRLRADAEGEWMRVLAAVEAAGTAPVPGLAVSAAGCCFTSGEMWPRWTRSR